MHGIDMPMSSSHEECKMKNVRFDKDSKTFSCTDEEGNDFTFDYKPSTRYLWDSINLDNFIVELCINPYLNHELDIFQLYFDKTRCGYIFPISILDSVEDLSSYRNIDSYINIAYNVLLRRIPKITKDDEFSKNFEDNICVCIFHKDYIPNNVKNLSACIPELRYFGYTYFEDNNTFEHVDGYKIDGFKPTSKSKIILSFKSPFLYTKVEITDLLSVIPSISNQTHRFIVLYQFIEYIISEAAQSEIMYEINRYTQKRSSNQEIINNLGKLATESTRIAKLFDNCTLNNDIKEEFKNAIEHLFQLIDYDYSHMNISGLFYTFRNQMTHNYRSLHGHKKELGEAIQAFERLVYNILATYVPKVSI